MPQLPEPWQRYDPIDSLLKPVMNPAFMWYEHDNDPPKLPPGVLGCTSAPAWARDKPCGRPAVVLMTAGCMHEHLTVRGVALCKTCRGMTQELKWYCIPCMEPADPKESHWCEVIHKIEEEVSDDRPYILADTGDPGTAEDH